MRWLGTLAYYVRALVWRDRADAELQDELRFHVERQTDEYIRGGLTRAEALLAALRSLGGLEQIKEEVRDTDRIPWLETLWSDVRHAVRLMRRTPAFTAVAILSLALGIGANTAVFNLLNAVVLRELPVHEPDRLVALEAVRPNGTQGGFSFPAFEEFARRQQVFSSLVGYWGDGIFNVEANGALIRGDVWAVTGTFYSELGVRPFAGRMLIDEDVHLSARAPTMVAVLGYGAWQREFGGDLSIIGRPVRIEGVPFTVIGIAPKGFTAIGITSEPDVTIPLTAVPLIAVGTPIDRFTTLKSAWVSAIGRLKPDKNLTEARAQLTALWPGIRAVTIPPDYVGRDRDDFLATRLAVTSAARGKEGFLRSRFTIPLYILLGVAGLMLVIACVNLASLMLSRTAARSHEMSVRLALGASRWRLARQMITEGLMLSSFAACGALVFANWSSHALKTLMIRDYLVPSVLDVSPDGHLLGFTAAAAVIAGVLLSLVPAWHVTRHNPALMLQQNARTLAGTGRAGKLLIVTQVALSFVLLMDAGLLVRTLQQLRAIDLGFRRDGVVMAGLFPRPGGYKHLDPDQYYPRLLERIGSLPGVHSAAFANVNPGFPDSKQLVAPLTSDAGEGVSCDFGRIGPHFFEVLDIRLLAGREFLWTDNSQARRVAIISRSLAARIVSGGDVLGRHIRIGSDPKRRDLEVVGIVSDMRLFDPRDPSPLSVYVPMFQEGDSNQWGELLIRTAGMPVNPVNLRRAVESLGRESILTYRPLQQVIDRAILQERVTAMLGGFFGALALLLAGVGLYGLMAFAVVQRRREIGIRMALGARRGEVVGMVIRETLILVVAGLAIGGPIALVAARFVGSLLFGLAPTDTITLVSIAAIMIAIGGLAGYLPGRRASRINPIEALRI
jgi:predicted permease